MGNKPKAPDPYKTADAQMQQNIGSTAVSGIMNNPNTTGPTGSTNYTISGYEEVVGPKGEKIKVPRYTQSTTLSPEMQRQWDSRNALINNMFTQTQEGFNKPDPTMPDWQTSYAPADGFSGDRKRVEEAMMSRGGELLNQNRSSEVARLAAMGLAPGSEKYGRVADQFERSSNDLAMQAILAGGQEQSRQLGEARTSAGFNNDARLGIGNEAQQRRTALLNQLTAAFTGSQVQQPNAPGYQGQGVGAPDISGMINNNYQAKMGAYNNRMSGIGGLVSAGLGFL